jgi:ABC-type spermidine/putrescine transport system permease subunit II
MFVALPAFQAITIGTTLTDAFSGSGVWASYWQSLTLSYSLAAILQFWNCLRLTDGYTYCTKNLGKWPSVMLDTLINVPIIVPRLPCVSLKFFWTGVPCIPEFLLLIFAHLAITYPYFVRSMLSGYGAITIDMEEAAKTLG